MERKDPERADPITRVIAARVRELRQQRGMSGATLGTAVRALGLTRWVASTVGKLETGRRESVTVREWLALAQELRVPPPLLIADPRHPEPVPIAEGVEADPWRVLMWLVGSTSTVDDGIVSSSLQGQDNRPLELIYAGRAVAEAAAVVLWTPVWRVDAPGFRDRPGVQLGAGGELPEKGMRRAVDDLHRRHLEIIRAELERIREMGAPVPQLQPEVVKRAVELDIDLPGQETS